MKTRRRIVVLTIFTLSLIIFGANIALAQEGLVPCIDKCDFKAFAELLTRVFNWLAIIGTASAAGIIAWGGMVLISNPANETKRGQAKEIIWAAVIGLIFLLAAWVIVNSILTYLTNKGLLEAERFQIGRE
jgi:hypothetical protein